MEVSLPLIAAPVEMFITFVGVAEQWGMKRLMSDEPLMQSLMNTSPQAPSADT